MPVPSFSYITTRQHIVFQWSWPSELSTWFWQMTWYCLSCCDLQRSLCSGQNESQVQYEATVLCGEAVDCCQLFHTAVGFYKAHSERERLTGKQVVNLDCNPKVIFMFSLSPMVMGFVYSTKVWSCPKEAQIICTLTGLTHSERLRSYFLHWKQAQRVVWVSDQHAYWVIYCPVVRRPEALIQIMYCISFCLVYTQDASTEAVKMLIGMSGEPYCSGLSDRLMEKLEGVTECLLIYQFCHGCSCLRQIHTASLPANNYLYCFIFD